MKIRWNFWILFLKIVHQKGLLGQIKRNSNFRFCRRILESYWQRLLKRFGLNWCREAETFLTKSIIFLFQKLTTFGFF